MTDVKLKIKKQIEVALPLLKGHIKDWASSHLIEPRPIDLISNLDTNAKIKVWLVTDHTGTNDSSCRIVYNEPDDSFGIECTLEDDRNWYMGNEGSFDEAVNGM